MRRNRLRLWLAALGLGLALAGPALTQTDPRPLVQSALQASSDRLRLRAFGLALEQGQLTPQAQDFMRRDLLAQGYGSRRGQPEITARQLSFAPILGWDGNINGGVLQDRLDLGWIVLEADPAARAKSGLVAGGSFGATTRLAWDQGRLIELTGATELAWSPRHQIGRADAMLRLCSRNHLVD